MNQMPSIRLGGTDTLKISSVSEQAGVWDGEACVASGLASISGSWAWANRARLYFGLQAIFGYRG